MNLAIIIAVLCGFHPRVDSAWRHVVDESGQYELRLPADLKPAPPEKHRFIHGGQVWESATMTVSLSFGHWAETSFDEMSGTRCSMDVAGTKVFTISGPDQILVWYQFAPGGHEPVLTVKSKTAKPDVRAGIALSLRRRPVAAGR